MLHLAYTKRFSFFIVISRLFLVSSQLLRFKLLKTYKIWVWSGKKSPNLGVKVLSIPRGGLTKIHHKAHQPPYEVGTPFHCSNQLILPSLFTCKIHFKKPQKESNMQVMLDNRTLIFEKWLILLVGFGHVPSPDIFVSINTWEDNSYKPWAVFLTSGGIFVLTWSLLRMLR